MKANLQVIERRRLLTEEAQTKARVELREVSEGVAETISRIRDRDGEDAVLTPAQGRGEKAKPAYRLSGLAWLASRPVDVLDDKGKPIVTKEGRRVTEPFLTREEEEEGRRYAELFNMARTGVVRSCLNFVEVRGGVEFTAAEIGAWARGQLHKIRHDLFRNHAGLIRVCDEICGEDKRPSEFSRDRRDYETIPHTLKIAMGLLVAHNR
jgi:hypothetical protein